MLSARAKPNGRLSVLVEGSGKLLSPTRNEQDEWLAMGCGGLLANPFGHAPAAKFTVSEVSA